MHSNLKQWGYFFVKSYDNGDAALSDADGHDDEDDYNNDDDDYVVMLKKSMRKLVFLSKQRPRCSLQRQN